MGAGARPDRHARQDIWTNHLPATAPIDDDVDIDLLSDRYELSGGLIKNAVLLAVGNAIILESSLSFLGLGVPPEIPTWGGMLADGRAYISTSWWLALFPGLCIFFTVLGFNLLGDGMRDLFDPRLKRSGAGRG